MFFFLIGLNTDRKNRGFEGSLNAPENTLARQFIEAYVSDVAQLDDMTQADRARHEYIHGFVPNLVMNTALDFAQVGLQAIDLAQIGGVELVNAAFGERVIEAHFISRVGQLDGHASGDDAFRAAFDNGFFSIGFDGYDLGSALQDGDWGGAALSAASLGLNFLGARTVNINLTDEVFSLRLRKAKGESTGYSGYDIGVPDKLSRRAGVDVVDYSGDGYRAFSTRDFLQEGADNPISFKSYEQVGKQGIDIKFVYDDVDDLAAYYPNSRVIEMYPKNIEFEAKYFGYDPTEYAARIFSHEAKHARRDTFGVLTNSHYDEYLSYSREFLFQQNRRPSLSERFNIWEQVKKDYPLLPTTGKVPVKSWGQ